MTDWQALLRGIAACEGVAMVSVLATEGSVPRGAGTRMMVTAEATYGTIGGGALEFRAIGQARAILRLAVGSWRVQDYPLGPMLGQCCGGRVRLLVEHVDRSQLGWTFEAVSGAVLVSELRPDGIVRYVGDGHSAPVSARGQPPAVGSCLTETIGGWRRPLYVFGAGHVGQALARHLPGLPLHLAWFDVRPSCASLAGVEILSEADFEAVVNTAPATAALVIMTHDHGLDYRLVHAALSRAPLTFTGLIGSSTKRARFMSRLARDGVTEAARARLTCPIGIDGITGKEPHVIAVALLAQLLQLPQGHSL